MRTRQITALLSTSSAALLLAACSDVELFDGGTGGAGSTGTKPFAVASSTSGSTPPASCGNDVREGGEECDGDDIPWADSCDWLGFGVEGYPRCNPTCDGYDVSVCQPTCGNGIVEEGEVCDLPPEPDPFGMTCRDLGHDVEGSPRCNATCDDWAEGSCEPTCGNGVVEVGEACEPRDDPYHHDLSCASFGYGGPNQLLCTGCAWDTSQCTGMCGDGVIDGYEDCEPGDLGGKDCTDWGYAASDGLACSNCRYSIQSCAASCNGVLEPGEQCDGGQIRAGLSCISFNSANPGADGGLTCLPGCHVDSSACPVCGDGQIEFEETCDDGNVVAGDGCDERCHVEPSSCATALAITTPASLSGIRVVGPPIEDEGPCSGPGNDRIVAVTAHQAGTLNVGVLAGSSARLSIRRACDDATSVVACGTPSGGGFLSGWVATAPVVQGETVYVFFDSIASSDDFLFASFQVD